MSAPGYVVVVITAAVIPMTGVLVDIVLLIAGFMLGELLRGFAADAAGAPLSDPAEVPASFFNVRAGRKSHHEP